MASAVEILKKEYNRNKQRKGEKKNLQRPQWSMLDCERPCT